MDDDWSSQANSSFRPRSDSRERREDRRRRDHDRDYHRSRRRERRSRSRSRTRSRSRSRGRDRERGGRRRDYIEQGDDFRDIRPTTAEADERRKNSPPRQRHEKDWRMKLTSIRDAHFNRNKQISVAQNQFTNDGSFLEMFKKKMAAQSSDGSSVMPNSLVLASSSIKYDSEISLPPLTTLQEPSISKPSTSEDQDLDGTPMPVRKPIPVPVSVGRRRNIKPLKTGVVFKKKPDSDEDEASQEKLDAWERYLQEVQKYKKDNCVEEDTTRPLVK